MDKSKDPFRIVKRKDGSFSKKKLLRLITECKAMRERFKGMAQRINLQADEIEDLKKALRDASGNFASYQLSYAVMKEKYENAMTYVTLRRPDVAKLEKSLQKQKAKAAAGVLKPITVNITQRRHAPKIEGI